MFPEEEVIRRIVEGETELFALLADRYGRAVHALVYRIVGNPEDAEEVTQEVLLKAFAKLADFRGRSSFATWLHRIACNTAVSFARRRHPLTHFDERQLALLPDDAPERLEAWAERQESLGALNRAIARLTPEERALVTLFYYEECTVAECASITATTDANVKVRLHRIRKKLYLMVKTELDENER